MVQPAAPCISGHLSPLVASLLTGDGLGLWLRVPHHLWQVWDVSFRPVAVDFFPPQAHLFLVFCFVSFSMSVRARNPVCLGF